MRRFAACGTLLLFAQSPLAHLKQLIEEAENAPEPQVESKAQAALSYFRNHFSSPIGDSLVALYVGQALDLLGYGVAYRGQFDSALFWSDSAYRLLSRFGHFEKAAEVKENIAYYYHQKGLIPQAIAAHQAVIQIGRLRGLRRLLFYALNNLGALFAEIGLLDTAAAFYKEALFLADSVGNPHLKMYTLHNLASLYESQELWDYALHYAHESRKLGQNTTDSSTLANTLSLLGYLYRKKQRIDLAIIYYRQAYETARRAGTLAVQAAIASSLGATYLSRGQWDSAYAYLHQASQLRERLGPVERFKAYTGLLNFFLLRLESLPPGQKAYYTAQALAWQQKASHLLRNSPIYDLEALMDFHLNSQRLFKTLGRYAEAYSHYQQYVLYRDSLRNLKNQRKALEARYQYEWFQHERSLREAMLRQQIAAEERQKRQQLWIGFLGFIALGLVTTAGVLWRLNRRIRAQRDLISEQKTALQNSYQIIAQQHEEIQQSLHYARRIQNALLAGEEKTFPLPNALWYQPQSVVSGDFYWTQSIQPGFYLGVVGDCTGHGVPGGFMTVLAISLLEQALKTEGKLSLPALAEFLHENFLALLHTEEAQGVRDGMEGTFFWLSLTEGKGEILTAGSYAWWIDRQGRVEEIPPLGPGIGLRRSLGGVLWRAQPFTLAEKSRLVLATDGLTDQLNPAGKRWGRRTWRTLLEETATSSPAEALGILQQRWEAYRAQMAPVDDVTVWLIDFPQIAST
ncbi:MAG: tetratricopeptide repeat protein [Bacteroidia bacterium]|nr:tetratricopeptide repeat protein [Bacteroidia bacterium]MDW8089411.1 tetratricopeptide repeat protein [Bacteroidia bacterium]